MRLYTLTLSFPVLDNVKIHRQSSFTFVNIPCESVSKILQYINCNDSVNSNVYDQMFMVNILSGIFQ